MSASWTDDTWPTADERWADEALFAEPQMRFRAESGGDDTGGGLWSRLRPAQRILIAALAVYAVLAFIVGALIGLLP
jgi:ABC-type dipeptide/oligopeptide/nickel transport system permease subunit